MKDPRRRIEVNLEELDRVVNACSRRCSSTCCKHLRKKSISTACWPTFRSSATMRFSSARLRPGPVNAFDPNWRSSRRQRYNSLGFTSVARATSATLGNLTLITGSLNPALSNSSWDIKRPELLKFGKLNLTQYFHGKDAETWDESAIEKRTEKLFEQRGIVWPALPAVSTDPASEKPAALPA